MAWRLFRELKTLPELRRSRIFWVCQRRKLSYRKANYTLSLYQHSHARHGANLQNKTHTHTIQPSPETYAGEHITLHETSQAQEEKNLWQHLISVCNLKQADTEAGQHGSGRWGLTGLETWPKARGLREAGGTRAKGLPPCTCPHWLALSYLRLAESRSQMFAPHTRTRWGVNEFPKSLMVVITSQCMHI